MTVLGALIGGLAVARWGVFRALLIGGVLQAVTNLAFAYVAIRGHDLAALAVAITADNLAGGAAGAALVAYLSGLCNIAYHRHSICAAHLVHGAGANLAFLGQRVARRPYRLGHVLDLDHGAGGARPAAAALDHAALPGERRCNRPSVRA